jgi:secondary thiamine-phosphate synthase enzyme
MEVIIIPTKSRSEFIDITAEVERIVSKSKTNGVCTIFCPHTTAGLTINENADPDVVSDIQNLLNKLVPYTGNYKHSEGNSGAHIKASLMGSSLNVLIENGKLVLGTWQGIYFCEFDGPRSRQVYVDVFANR